jgi:hypothetical protein
MVSAVMNWVIRKVRFVTLFFYLPLKIIAKSRMVGGRTSSYIKEFLIQNLSLLFR